MGILVKLEASFTRRAVDLTSTGYRLLREGTALGTVVERPLFSQTVDAQSVRVTGASRDAREQQLKVEVSGSTHAELQTRLDAVQRVCEDLSRRGGVLVYRSGEAITPTRYRVAAARLSEPVVLGEYEAFRRAVITIAIVADPYGLAQPLDLLDAFSTNTLATGGIVNVGGADWTVTSGSPTISGGRVTTATPGTQVGLRHHVRDVMRDQQLTCEFVATTGMALTVGVEDSASTYMLASIAGGSLYGYVANGGTVFSPNPQALFLTAGNTYWLVVRREGTLMHFEVWTVRPTPMGSPAFATIAVIPAGLFDGASGRMVVKWTPTGAGGALEYVRRESYAYRTRTFPDVLRLDGPIGGTIDALAAIAYTGSGGTAPAAMLYAWWPRVEPHNMVSNGAAEVIGAVATGAGSAYGWSTAAVSGVIGAATSIVRDTTAANVRTGTAGFVVVTPATTDTGASFAIYRRNGFRRGVTYTAEVLGVRSASQTTALRVKLGVSGDIAVGASSALTSTFAPRSVTWTPAVDSDMAYFAIGINAATATTFALDDVLVYEGTVRPASDIGGYGPGIVPGVARSMAAASTTGAYWTQTTNAAYLTGQGVFGAGPMAATACIDLPILPHLFAPDDYRGSSVKVAVFARCFAVNTQQAVTCALSVAPDQGTAFGARRYGSARLVGRPLVLPSTGSGAFRMYYLGTVTLQVDREQPRRELLRLAFANAPGSTGTFALDFVALVPAEQTARSRSGVPSAQVPLFIASAAETTKTIVSDLSGVVGAPNQPQGPDDGLAGAALRLPPDGVELLVLPSSTPVDLTEDSVTNSEKLYYGTVQVAAQPRVHLLSQGGA